MAVTRIWPIKGRLRNVIDYTVNPEKTFNPDYTFEELQTLKDVIDYAMESDKTEKQFYVTGVNCTAGFAREQMVNTKRLFKKEYGILAFHGYQSFKPGEVTPELAHEIGIKLAEKLWGDRFEVVVSTHLDKHHLHSHFVLNSVSFVDGKKFNSCRKSYYEMRRASDELCREYGLSVIENPRKAPSRMQYLAEKNGEMTKYTSVKRDIQECMAMSYSPEKFEQLMEKRRYTMFFIGDELAVDHPFIKSPIRLCDLGEGFSTDEILEFIYNNKHYLKRINLPEQARVKDVFFDGDVSNSYVTFYDLYSHFVPGLAYVKKYPEKNREVSFYLQKEILKFDKFCEEQNLLCDNDVESYEDLIGLKEKTMREYNELINLRKEVRNAVKRADRSGDTQNANELREHNKDITAHLVDEGRIAFTPAVELSYLAGYEQEQVYCFYENEEVTPSYSQSVRLKKLSQEFRLTDEKLFEIMSEAKANQKDFLKIPTESIDRYFKSRFTEKQKQEFVIKAVEHYHRYLMRQRDAR